MSMTTSDTDQLEGEVPVSKHELKWERRKSFRAHGEDFRSSAGIFYQGQELS